MTKSEYKRTKFSCYFSYLAMSSVFSLPPLLFASFRQMYGISYTLLGTLVLVNFCTQLGVDLIFSFFSKHFNIHKTVRYMPLVTTAGLCVYALIPMLFPQYAYVGLVVGTLIFSVAAGLGEVLVSPTVAALPSENPERDMSALHSLYAYGFVGVVFVSTLFLHFVGREYWVYLTLFWAVLPVIASILLITSKLPDMNSEPPADKSAGAGRRVKSLLLCVICIFFGACAENTMSSWISVYTENALHISKLWGDILGMCLFAILLGLARSAYAKYGKNIMKVMTWGMAISVVCYLVVAFSPSAALSLAACVALGISTAMLWPGTLILMEEKIPAVGVAAYALMAAGGDLGASVAPQAMGAVVDGVTLSQWAQTAAATLSLTPEQVGFKVGMLMAAIFPLLGVLVLLYMKKYFGKQNPGGAPLGR